MTLKHARVFLILLAMIVIMPVGVTKVTAENLPCTFSKESGEIQTFRLLAVEGTHSGGNLRVQSCQYLIRSLLRFSNWNNQTHTSYIELLSEYSIDECIGEAKPFWKGESTKVNLQNEIINFLGQASSTEIAILCIDTDGDQNSLYLGSYIYDHELLEWLQAVNTTTVVTIDACHSGSFIADGEGGLLGPGRIVLCSSLSNQVSVGISQPYIGGYFTGFEYVGFPGGPPVGIIGATIAGTDINGDGWLSVLETFIFAESSVEGITNQDPVSFNGLPENFDPPLVLFQPEAGFYCAPSYPLVNRPVIFNASNSKGNLTTYEWNFGDSNATVVTEPVVSHVYTESGNHTVILKVTDAYGQWDTKTSIVIVKDKLLGDINSDDTVDIFDAILLANAYNSQIGDPNWNLAADLNSDSTINLFDAIILSNSFNQHYP